jgi:hypothetical protein
MSRKFVLGAVLLIMGTGTCFAAENEPKQTVSVSVALGYKNCSVYGPFTVDQVVAREAERGRQLNWPYRDRPCRDWDELVNGLCQDKPYQDWHELVAQYKPGDSIYYLDCTKEILPKFLVGQTFYALTRDNITVTRALPMNFN